MLSPSEGSSVQVDIDKLGSSLMKRVGELRLQEMKGEAEEKKEKAEREEQDAEVGRGAPGGGGGSLLRSAIGSKVSMRGSLDPRLRFRKLVSFQCKES